MKKQPRKTKQWAEEANKALDVAWGLLYEEVPSPNEDQKLELVAFAPAIAGTNRGITDKKRIKKAYQFVYNRTAEDIQRKEEGELIYYSISFLLGYLDSHISFGIISEKKSDEIMGYLTEYYDICRKN